jgi:hypothetical protein
MWRNAGEDEKNGNGDDYFGVSADLSLKTTSGEFADDFWPELGDGLDINEEYDSAFEFDDTFLGSPGQEDATATTLEQSISQSSNNSWIEPRIDREKLLGRIRNSDPKIIRRGVRIEVCAVWDTVGALGPLAARFGIFRPRHGRKLGFIRSDLSQGINNAFQALSLHDRRRSFLPMVWRKPTQGHIEMTNGTNHRLEQCWFMGYHGDVGGGTHGEGLAHFSLAWMLARLRRFVDMDAANFWSPRLSLSNWHVVNDAGKPGRKYLPSSK